MYTNLIKHRNKLDFKKTDISWPTFTEEVNDMSESFGQTSIQNKLLSEYLNTYHTIIKHNSIVNFLNYNLDSHLRLFRYNQHLTWHDDGGDNRAYAVTYYLNKTWNESWGGELMFKSDEGSGFIPVLGNSMCIVKVGLRHKVNAVLKKTHPRLSIQTWVYNKEKE
mgnify:CR=1 FL=1